MAHAMNSNTLYLRTRVLLFVILYILLGLGTSSTSFASATTTPICRSSLAKQEAPQAIGSIVRHNRFVTGRGLWDYASSLHSRWKSDVLSLGSDGHWLDLGSGKAIAMREFINKKVADNGGNMNSMPHLTAIAYTKAHWFIRAVHSKLIQFIFGDFNSLSIDKIPQADVITDVYGVFSYSLDLHETLERVFKILKFGGRLYLETEFYRTNILDPDSGELMGIKKFLKERIANIELLEQNGRVLLIKKGEVNVPRLKLIHFYEDAPPSRSFEILN